MARDEIDGFRKLDPITSIYRAPTSNGHTAGTRPSSTPQEPCLIVLCSWMSAAPKHIAKYTTGYRRLFPSTDILLVQSTLPGVFIGQDLTLAHEVLENYIKPIDASPEDARKPVILHMFSNGGANNAVLLASQLRDKGLRSFDAVILDSCPGRGEVTAGTRAVAMSLPNNYLLRLAGWYVIYAAFVAYVVIATTFGIEDILSRIRRVLNDPSVIPNEVPRLYVYSEKDLLVSAKDVHAHAEDARKAGYHVVKEEVFTAAPHCALLNEDAERYWNEVRALVAGIEKS